jgi:hypothetical protein
MGRKMGSMIRNWGVYHVLQGWVALVLLCFGYEMVMVLFLSFAFSMVGFFGCVLSYSLGTNPRGVKDS